MNILKRKSDIVFVSLCLIITVAVAIFIPISFYSMVKNPGWAPADFAFIIIIPYINTLALFLAIRRIIIDIFYERKAVETVVLKKWYKKSDISFIVASAAIATATTVLAVNVFWGGLVMPIVLVCLSTNIVAVLEAWHTVNKTVNLLNDYVVESTRREKIKAIVLLSAIAIITIVSFIAIICAYWFVWYTLSINIYTLWVVLIYMGVCGIVAGTVCLIRYISALIVKRLCKSKRCDIIDA